MIELQAVARRFGDVVAVDDVSLRANDGEIVGLLGPNGAGKTTVMRMLTGLVRPDRGAVRVDGVDVAQHPAKARAALGMLPDAKGLNDHLTARENIALYAALQGVPSAQAQARIDALAQELVLTPLLPRRVKGFSQGERMKVAIARALVHAPRNVVLDEPTNGLDIGAVRGLRAVMRARRDEGCCVVFSSHVMQEVEALCDRIVVMGRGRVLASGTGEELREMTGQRDLEQAFVELLQRAGAGGHWA